MHFGGTCFALVSLLVPSQGLGYVQTDGLTAKGWSKVNSALRANPQPIENDEATADSGEISEFDPKRKHPLWEQRSTRWIILVDDEESIRNAVGKMLSDQGYRVTAAASGEAALQRILPAVPFLESRAEVPDVVVSDIRMPGGMDGLEFLQNLRSHENLLQIPVVLLTAKGKTLDRIAGYQAGADVYLPKPFDPDELVAIIDSLILRAEELTPADINWKDLQQDVRDIKSLLLDQGGGGVGNGWVERSHVFLAPDERRILELVCQGLRNREIADKTFFSKRRVEQLLTSLFRKTNAKNRTELIRWAVSSGNVSL